ncbi:MAG: FMN-binding protein [Candidatus Marinamargulisbacteria bacterium]
MSSNIYYWLSRSLSRLWLNGWLVVGLLSVHSSQVFGVKYLTPNDAKTLIWNDVSMVKVPIELTKAQIRTIQTSSKTYVRNKTPHVWKTIHGGWFILDQVIGKHENIDIAIGIDANGAIQGVEVLEYRETYGDAVRHPAWLAQFLGKTGKKILKLDRDIKNISGATLSSRHITDGVNRWLATWEHVLSQK